MHIFESPHRRDPEALRCAAWFPFLLDAAMRGPDSEQQSVSVGSAHSKACS